MGTKRHDETEFTHRVLANNDVGWLSLSSEDGPYLVPVNYFWHDGQILIHTSYEGRKIDCLMTASALELAEPARYSPLTQKVAATTPSRASWSLARHGC